MPPRGARGRGRPRGRPRGVSRGGLGSRTVMGTDDNAEAGPAAIPAANTFNPGITIPVNPYTAGTTTGIPTNPYAPGTIPVNPYAPGASMPNFAAPQQQAAQPQALGVNQPDQPRPGESPVTFRRRMEARQLSEGMQTRRRARLRAAREAEDEGWVAETGQGPKRRATWNRTELIEKLNDCDSRVTRSAVERDEELINCQYCGRGATWPMKCRGGDGCTECEARGLECVRGHRKHFDMIRARQLQGVEPWRSDTDQCRQCKSRGMQCWMPGNQLPGPCNNCQQDGLPCDVTPLPVRRCPKCHWEHKCVECARNHLRCDGQIPCLVCLHKGIQCVGLKPDGSCPDIPMSTYGTGLPPHPLRTSVRPLPEQRNWPPPSGRLEIPYNPQLTGVVNTGPQPPGIAGPSPGPAPESSPPDFAGPSPGPAPGSSPPELPGGGGSSEEEGQNDGQEEPLPRDPNFDPNNIRESLYNPYDDDKPPCSHCAADIHNRTCDQDTPCWECLRRHIVEAEDCRTSRPCEFCFMNEMPCDAGTPCQHCMFLGFGADECRPEGISEQRYFPNPPDPNESDEEPFIHPLDYEEAAEFDYSCAFCVAYGFKRCNPQDRPCLTCVQFGRTEQQCRFEERCGRCLELDLPCDGKMPCSLCATADGLTSMMCLGRGDTTMPGVNDPVPEGNDIGMGQGGHYPVLPGYENAYPPQEHNNVFGFGPGDPLQQEFDPFGPNNPQQQPFDPFGPDNPPQQEFIDPNRLPAGVPGQSILPQNEVPRAPPGGFFQVPAHVRTALLPHYRIRTDVYTNGNFDPIPGGHVSWNDWNPQFRCKVTLASGLPCHNLPTIDCDGDEEHGHEKFGVCTRCRNRAVEYTAYLMGEVEEKKNLFCCATCSQAQMIAFTERGFQDGETLVDNHCDCDAQMRAWLCFGCRSKVIHTVGNRMISTRERLTRDSDNAILCPRCGVEPGNKEAAYTLARGLAKCSSCWSWINYAT